MGKLAANSFRIASCFLRSDRNFCSDLVFWSPTFEAKAMTPPPITTLAPIAANPKRRWRKKNPIGSVATSSTTFACPGIESAAVNPSIFANSVCTSDALMATRARGLIVCSFLSTRDCAPRIAGCVPSFETEKRYCATPPVGV